MSVSIEMALALDQRVSKTTPVSARFRSGRGRERQAEFADFYQAEYAYVARTVFLIIHDRHRSEEVAQDAFVQLFAHWGKVSRYERPDAWVRRVAIRLAVRLGKRERVRAAIERNAPQPAPPRPADVDLLRAIGRLPLLQRAVVVLFYFEDRPLAEIAHLVGCSVGAAKVNLHRARLRLAESLGEEVDDRVG